MLILGIICLLLALLLLREASLHRKYARSYRSCTALLRAQREISSQPGDNPHPGED
jgi:hypothetical protein